MMFDIQSSLLLKTIILRIIFFYLQDLIPPLFFCCWDSWAERDTILQIYPPPLFFFWDTDLQDLTPPYTPVFFLAEIETPGI